MDKKVVIAGIGMGNPDTATIQVIKAIENAEVLIGAERMLRPFEKYGKKMVKEYKADAIAETVRESSDTCFAILVSGDPGLYSGAESIAEALKEFSPKVMPGISSVSYFCSSIGTSWNDTEVISAHGRKINIASEVRRSRKTFVLTDGNISGLLSTLCKFGFGNLEVHIGERLSYPEEKIVSGTAGELANMDFDRLAVMLVINPKAESRILSGIGDDAFERGNVPMTKREIRAITMSALKILPDSIVYDVGAGTGSVSIESSYAAYRGTVYAIECETDAIELLHRNCIKMAADNVRIIEGTAPEALVELPAPDLVFIGGSKGNLESIIDTVIEKNRSVHKDFRLVINAVSLETIASSVSMLSGKNALKIEYTQISSARSRAAGNYNLLQAQNPVFIIKADFIMH